MKFKINFKFMNSFLIDDNIQAYFGECQPLQQEGSFIN
jgi:hypothetical protein